MAFPFVEGRNFIGAAVVVRVFVTLDAIGRRAVVSKQRKLQLLARATGAMVVAPASGRARLSVLPAVQFLVDATAVAAPPPGPASRSFDDRIGWVIGLTERQARQQGAFR